VHYIVFFTHISVPASVYAELLALC